MSSENIMWLLLYFPQEKTFSVLHVTDTSFSDDYASNTSDKMVIKAPYDGLSQSALVVQMAQSESDLSNTLQYATTLKQRKKLPIEEILKVVPRMRPVGRQHVPPVNVSEF